MPEAVSTPANPAPSTTDVGPVVVPDLDSFPPTGVPKHSKLGSWEFYRSIGSPQRVGGAHGGPVGAGVACAEPSLRRRPRLHAHDQRQAVRSIERHGSAVVRAVLLQRSRRRCSRRPRWCRTDATPWTLTWAVHSTLRGAATTGRTSWRLAADLCAHQHPASQPAHSVTAKMRVYETVDKTVAYARMLERAGAQIITVHGRTRSMKGHHTGLADWAKIKAVKEALRTPTSSSAIKAHLFRLCRPGLEVHRDLREALGKSRFDHTATGEARIATYRAFVTELERRLDLDRVEDKWNEPQDPPLPGSVSFLTPPDPSKPDKHRPAFIPHWLAQPYFRPPLVTDEQQDDHAKKARRERVAETAQGKVRAEAKAARHRSESAEPVQGDEKRLRTTLPDDTASLPPTAAL
ncbi:hypothetical protein L1887_50828 [Cichorium endivia]|nr:hypothetical protein L1887_50828 [Cichorium endivia]